MKIKNLSTSGAGDVVELLNTPKNKHLDISEYSIISQSSNRAIPPCPYYQKCGGCNLQHLDDKTYFSFKNELGVKALEQINQKFENIKLIKTSINSRRRATLKATIKNKEIIIGFFEAKSNNIVKIDNCVLLEEKINSLIPELKIVVSSFNPIHFSQNFIEISITSIDNGLDVLFKSKYEISQKERNAINRLSPKVIRASWKKDTQYYEIFTRQAPIISFNNNQAFLPVDSFLQPTLEGQEAIISFILNHVNNSQNIIDIFAGIGTYSIPLAVNKNCKILACEGNYNIKTSLKHFPNIEYEIRDLYKKPIKKEKLSLFDFAIINPPRNGATPQMKSLASSNLNNIILVSCSHDTFSRDSKFLIEAGFHIEDFMLIDQFLYTAHIELIAYFKR